MKVVETEPEAAATEKHQLIMIIIKVTIIRYSNDPSDWLLIGRPTVSRQEVCRGGVAYFVGESGRGQVAVSNSQSEAERSSSAAELQSRIEGSDFCPGSPTGEPENQNQESWHWRPQRGFPPSPATLC